MTVTPKRIDEVLTNPGMGFASFHFGWWCDLPPTNFAPQECAQRVRQHWPENYPEAGTAYFRWHWRDLEPERGKIDFDMIDAAIQAANVMGMTLSFRVMTVDEGRSGVPDWLISAPYKVAGQWQQGDGENTFWPDYRDGTFQSEHARFVEALGNRYNGHPAVDHVDIGTVGCWGEWNTACLQNNKGIIDVYEPANGTERKEIETALTQIIDHYLSAFGETPVVMLGLEGDEVDLMVHATQGGAGWRLDCWGDWGIWGDAWNHQEDLYPSMISAATALDPGFADVWKHAPVELEVCATLARWEELGWSASGQNAEVQRSFDWALEQHASVLNAKSGAVPSGYVAAIDELLRHNGYRFVVERFTHEDRVRPGSSTTFVTDWSNLGVAPHYLPRTLAYRLRGGSIETTLYSEEDTRDWLPGSWTVSDSITIPANLPKGAYEIDIAVLDRDGQAPATQALPPLQLGIDGRGTDGWYTLSRMTVE